MGTRSRRKGINWERECSNRLTKATGIVHNRNLLESRTGNSGDIVPGEMSFLYQCKVGAMPPIYPALREAAEAAKIDGRIPIALIKRNQSSPGTKSIEFAVIPMEEFLKIMSDLSGLDRYKTKWSAIDFRSK